MTPAGRVDGYVPIGDYAVLGDGRTVALVASDGRIDWFPVPTLDAPPLCAALLDPAEGGCFALAPVGAFEVERRYVEGTNVLETTYTTAAGTTRVTEALNTGMAGRLPWTELVRRVEGLTGAVPMRWELIPGDRFGRARSWVTRRRGVPTATLEDQTVAVVADGAGPCEVSPHAVRGAFTIEGGARALVAAVATEREPVYVPDASAIDRRLDRTIESWRRWSGLIGYQGPWESLVRRSALVLKTLIAERSGAIAAAATTSLPEAVGGSKNFDYRYAWVRDSSFAVDALINLGLHEEVHGAVSWLLGAIKTNGGRVHVFYSLDGSLPEGEEALGAAGYRHSRPVRAGNSAAGQLQLGVYGDLFDTVHRYAGEGHLIDRGTGDLLAGLADDCCDRWRRADSGLWELGEERHYTISKMACWTALDRAVRLAAEGQLPAGRAERWKAEAEDVREWTNRHCWSDDKGAYTFFAGSDQLDAAVLLAGRTGFDRGPRLASTIDAVERELGRGPLLYRYSGMDAEEGAFLACSYWMVEALIHTGQADRARRLMDAVTAATSHLGLMSEQVDPASGQLLGNLPQGLSHLALINAAVALAAAPA